MKILQFFIVTIALVWGLNGCGSPSDVTVVDAEEAESQRTFTNPVADGADPRVLKRGDTYYYCGSGGAGIHVSASTSMTALGGRQVVRKAPVEGWNRTNTWAPELHFIDGKWYIYYTAGEAGPPFIHQRSGVLESMSDDPFGPYEDKGMLYTGDNIDDPSSVKWAIDLTTVVINGQRYAIWSGWLENADTDKTEQHLYIATMENPYTINSNRVKISSPEEEWETGRPLSLNEGPQILRKDEKLHAIYATRESWMVEYRLGQLTLMDTLQDPMDPANWVKKGPVFLGTDQVLGAGHASFTTSPDGKEDWIFYHSKKTTEPGWDRDIRLQKFTWNKDGSPDFGIPIPAGTPIPVPSGQK